MQTWDNPDALVAAGFPVQTHDADATVFTYGDPGDSLFVVLSGEVQLSRYGTVLETVKRGGLFGEMALIDDAPRSATATAAGETQLIAVDRTSFDRFVREYPPFARFVMGLMAARLRRMNQSL
jgi:CRP/FNR family cyclic AMP-dependent transcriptional regulator